MKDQGEGVVEPTAPVEVDGGASGVGSAFAADTLLGDASRADGEGSVGRRGRRRRGGSSAEREPRRPKSTVVEWTLLVVAAVVIAYVIKAFLFQAFFIPSDSMLPTLEKGDRVLVNKLSYRLHDVHRGDIVVFKAPAGTKTEEIKDLVKRVIGLPGENIEGRGSQISIDGRVLDEPYLPRGARSKTFATVKVPPSMYFVLGDNRLESKDSTVFGPIKRSDIVGRVFVRIWPPSRIGFL